MKKTTTAQVMKKNCPIKLMETFLIILSSYNAISNSPAVDIELSKFEAANQHGEEALQGKRISAQGFVVSSKGQTGQTPEGSHQYEEDDGELEDFHVQEQHGAGENADVLVEAQNAEKLESGKEYDETQDAVPRGDVLRQQHVVGVLLCSSVKH